jgi:peptidoglycan hydrolase-like protein with peptidoglycan-binding domain
MAIKIGHASISEKGTIYGNTGDQTGGEICTRTWYSFPWDVYLECNDDELAEKAAKYMEEICANNSFGYSQYTRWDGYNSIVANGGKVQGARGDFDCSSLVISCYALAGLPITTGSGYTGTIEKTMLDSGKFTAYKDAQHIYKDIYGKRGGIYLNTKNHVCMALSNGSMAAASPKPDNKVETPKPNTTSSSTSTTYSLTDFVTDVQVVLGASVDGIAGPETLNKTITVSRYRNATHPVVKYIQKRLLAMGKKLPVYGADGDFGAETEAAVKSLQQDIYPTQYYNVDGEISRRAATWEKLLGLR